MFLGICWPNFGKTLRLESGAKECIVLISARASTCLMSWYSCSDEFAVEHVGVDTASDELLEKGPSKY